MCQESSFFKLPLPKDLSFEDTFIFPSKNIISVGCFGLIEHLQSKKKKKNTTYFLCIWIDPRQWHVIDATCKGSYQSPINIVTKKVIYDKSLQPLNFEGYDVKGSSKWNIENNGHTGKHCLIHPYRTCAFTLNLPFISSMSSASC